MKYFLSVFFLLFISVAHAQMMINVSAGTKTVSVNPDEYNLNKTLYIYPERKTNKDGFLTVKVSNETVDTSWNRFFMIYDSANAEIATLISTAANIYSIDLPTLISTMKQNENYFLCTIIHPKDPQKAMLVKVARSFVCKIKLSDN